MKIVLTGGGSGGHIMPVVAIIREFKKNDFYDLIYLGPKSNHDYLIKQEGVKVINIFSGKIRRYATVEAILQNIIDIVFFFPLGLIQSIYYLLTIKSVKCVFSKGGYGGFLPSLGAILLNIPLITHESDVVPGKSNAIFASLAKKSFLSFPKENLKSNEEIIGNPVRQELFETNYNEAVKELSLEGIKPVIFIFGGSLGSQRINNLIIPNLDKLLLDYEIIHMCGSSNCQKITQTCSNKLPPDFCKRYHVLGFLDEKKLSAAFEVCDVIVARAGAGSIFEIAKAKKPSILIPLKESAQNHQLQNARVYEKIGGCYVLEEDSMEFKNLADLIKKIIDSPELSQRMSDNAKIFAKDFAQKRIVRYLLDFS